MFLAGLRFFTCYDNNVIRIINMFMKMKTRNSDQCLKNVKFSLVLTVNHDLVWPSTVWGLKNDWSIGLNPTTRSWELI